MALSYVFFSIAVFYIYINAKKIRDQLAEKMGEYVVEKIQEYVALPIGDYLDTPIGCLLGCLLCFAVVYIAEKIKVTLEEKIGEYVVAPIRRQLGYVYFYNSNIKDFRTKRETLENTRDGVQRLVDAAERKGEAILQDVREWLTDVNKIREESRKLLDDVLQSNLKLFYTRRRYAKEKTVDVDKLIQVGINFDKVSTSKVRFRSRVRIFKDIMKELKDDKIKVIGIYGMPGVGKTTLAKQVMQQAKDDKLFDEVLMLVVSQTPDWEKIQQQIAKALDPKVENKVESQREGPGSTQDKKRILIVLDDIWENVELDEAVGISFGMKQEGWKVVLTSRKKDVYDRMGIAKNFSVEVINEAEAWNLFRKTAGDSIESSDLHPLAVEIAKECGGLPIAIVTIASTIRGKSYSFLRDVLNKLQNSTQEQKVNSAIELSYNHVDYDEAKKIFLLCCLFPEDYDIPIQVLMMYGMGLRWFEDVGTVEKARDRVHALVHSLKSSCLLQDVEEEECVKMHDVIRDVAVKIASKEEDRFLVKAGAGSKVFPEGEALNRYTAISLFSDDFHELPGALECPKLKILLLGSTGSSSQVPNNFSLRMESPEVLNLFCIDFSSPPQSSPPPLMVVRNLKNLRTLCLTRCSVKDTSSIIGKELKNLEYLSFRESAIKELPEEIGMLTQLKLLDLTGCKELKVIPRDVIGGLSRLEGLYMEGSFDKWELERQDEERKNASLGELKRLSHLISLDIEISDANLLPEDLVFENLSRFKIYIDSRFWVGVSHSNMLSLKLNVNTALKDGIKELLKKVEHLRLLEMEGLKSVVYDLDREGFQNLRRLHVYDCGEVEYIFNASEWFLPVVFPKLEKLDLDRVPKLKEICHGQLPAMFFSELQELTLHHLPGLINLWNDRAHHLYFHNLTVVRVHSCDGLKNLFSHSVAKGLSKLVKLDVKWCRMMEEIVGNEKEAASAAAVDDIMFPKLRSLTLWDLPKLKNLCLKMEGDLDTSTEEALFGKKVVFPALETLQIHCVGKLTEIRHSQLLAETLGFQNLRSINMDGCSSLKNLFSHSVAKGLSKLVKLEVTHCEMMEEIVGNDKEAASAAAVDDIMFPKLRSLKLRDLPNLKNFCLKMEGDLDTSTEEALFGKKVVFPALKTLRIIGISDSTEIQHSQLLAETLGFQRLRSIDIERCNSLKSLFSPSMASSLVQLKELKIRSCKVMESIIAEERKAEEYCQEIIVFPERRRRLRLLNLPKLISFMKTFTFIFSVQQNLLIKDEIIKEALQEGNPHDPVVQPLFDQKVTLPTMEVLNIDDLVNLKAIWHPLQLQAESSCQLKVLEVKRCHKISNVFPSNLLKRLTNLEEVSIEKCDSVEIIFEVERLGVEDGCGTMTLSQLKKLSLSGLPMLFTSKHPNPQKLHMDDEEFKEKPDESNSCITIRPLFDEWVAFTNLEVLRIIDIENLQVIFHSQLPNESFSQLRFLEVKKCHKLSRIASSNLLPRLKNLKELVVEECNSMENIFELEGKGHTAISLFQLEKVKLRDLSNLTIFCSGNYNFELPALKTLSLEQCPKMQTFSLGYMSTPKLETVKVEDYKKAWKGELNSTVDHLFQEKVCLPTLEVLEIKGLDNLKDIWHPQLLAESFRQLRILKVESCHKISNVIPSNLLKGLKNLEEVFVKECDSLQMIFEVELLAVKDRHGTGTLPQLRKLELSGLPKLLTFEHPLLQNLEMDNEKIEEKPNESNSSIPIRPLFDELVAFTNLEVLRIIDIENLQVIFHSQLPHESFSQLRFLEVKKCHKLSRVASSNLLPRLKNLKELVVEECNSMEKIFELEGKGHTAISLSHLEKVELRDLSNLMIFCSGNYNFELPALKTLSLEQCPKMQTFSSGYMSTPKLETVEVEDYKKAWKGELDSTVDHLFQEKVCLPTLEVLEIKGLDNLKDIWHPQLLAESFRQLRVLKVKRCHKISNVFPSNLLKGLKNLEEVFVKECDSLQMIFEVELLAVKDRHGTGTLSQLRKLELSGLPKLFTFEHPLLQNLEMDDEKIEEKPDESNSCIPIRPLFNELVAFTNLEVLRIINIENLQVIFHIQLPHESFSQLRLLEVKKCHKLSRVASSNLLPRLKNLKELVVEECNSMKKIFELEGEGHAAFSLFQLTKVELCHLPNLMMFCSGNCDFELPLLFDLVLEKCPKMQKFSSGLNSTPNLSRLYGEHKFVEEHVFFEGPKFACKIRSSISVEGDLNSFIHHLFREKAKLKSDKSSGKEVEEGAEGENASAHQRIQRVISEIQEEA